ncbi:rCG60920, isoform CRA_d [Rattus norvegicus]|uniref:RCG60920, isoform CRA_d n=1 Tax=Rattus norvegicus TaxID=10116 RepID=A6JKQ3_RAT|nr:rCG60920, isoform CRA_d [Rattus norvegicus]
MDTWMKKWDRSLEMYYPWLLPATQHAFSSAISEYGFPITVG